MSNQEQRTEESLRHEYVEAVQLYRHHSNLRFGAFSIFIAIMAGVGLVAFGKEQFVDGAAKIARIAGIALVLIFWVYEERLSTLIRHFIKTACDLERLLGYTVLSVRPAGKGYLPSRPWIMRAFYVTLGVLWLYTTFIF